MQDDSFPNFFWKLDRGSVSAMKLIKIPKEYIVVGAENKHIISIFSLLGKIHCLYNLEFPLPTLWQLSVSSFEKRKKQYQIASIMLQNIEEYNLSGTTIKKSTSYNISDLDESDTDKRKFAKQKTILDEDDKKKSIFTFNELLTKIDTDNGPKFQPCTLSLRKIDARNRKIL
jgi:hypothetical protein